MLNWRSKTPSRIMQPKYSDFHELYENSYCRIIYFNDKEQSKPNSNCVVTAKYGILSFIPLFLFEQLRYFPIQYFIFVSILQQIPGASPIGQSTTLIPLIFMICLKAIKSIIADIVRHIADFKINRKCVKVLRNGVLIQERWSKIGVGDILRIQKNEMFPADLILLSSSELHGTCHLDTKLLDYETHLKIKQCPQEISHKNLHSCINLNGTVECELPNKLLYNFLGRLTLENSNKPIPLDNKQFLPRGTILRNAKWIHGVVVYTGQETKQMLNQNLKYTKESSIDKILRLHTKIIFVSIFILGFICAMCYTWWTRNNFETHWYLKLKDVDAYAFILQIISIFILFHNTVPVTLQVYIEFVRLMQAWFIENDIDMYHEESNKPARVKSSNLNVELGKVKYIFANKTGTLTQNVMKFKHCSIAGELYLDEYQNKIQNNLANHSTKSYITEFLRMMSICHTVIPEKLQNLNKIVYNSSSLDEQALVTGAKQFGFVLNTRSQKTVTISTLDGEEQYEILNIIEFTNQRKKMSVIVRAPNSQIKLYCKGADIAILKCLSKFGEEFKNKSMVHLNNFARAGYRTLCFAYVNISDAFYETWRNEYLEASSVLLNRDDAINKVAKKIEKELKLIGVTAVENKLQDNVSLTIQALMNAKLKVWILTGDKQETAINIGLSTGLMTKDGPIIVINESNLTNLRQALHKKLFDLDLRSLNNYTLIIYGRSLKHAFSNDLKMDFLKLCINCKSVICCRISSKQKTEIVDLVTKYTNEVTLAIGDGAYDVPILNKASIGVGTLGFKDLQAFHSSDYSIAQFKYLPKLLFVHGAWNYERMSKMIYFNYYKIICFNTLQLWFEIYSGWSSQVIFNRWIICAYNVIFTAAPPLMIGLFLTTYSAKTRLNNPELYSQNKNVFNYKKFLIWILIAVFHSIIIFWICLFTIKHQVLWKEGITSDYSIFGHIIYTCTLIIVCLKAGLHTQSWSLIVHLATWTSILSWILFIIIYNEVGQMLLYFSISIKLNIIIFKTPILWVALIFTISVILILDLVMITLMRTFFKNGAILISWKSGT